jgi:putative heme-binding domain-containing protein
VRRFIARRLADEAAAKGNNFDLAPLVAALAKAKEVVQIDLLAGAREGLRGRKSLKMPAGWPAVYAKLRDGKTREDAIALALLFGDPEAVTDLRKVVQDAKAPSAERVAAIQSLVAKRVPEFASVLHDQLEDKATRQAALRGLAAYAHEDTPKRILAVYKELTTEEKQDAVAALASRKEYAFALLDAVAAGTVLHVDVSAFVARQLYSMNDQRLNLRIKSVWGDVRETSADKQKLVAKYRDMLSAAAIRNAKPANGRVVFAKTCQQCHKLFDEGGDVGPDLTGANRTNLDYILLNLIDPSSEVGRDYRMSVVRTLDERTVTGIVVERTAARVVVQTATELVTLSPDDIVSVKDSPLSIMPEGQLSALTREQVRDLIAYLASKTQVALPPDAK